MNSIDHFVVETTSGNFNFLRIGNVIGWYSMFPSGNHHGDFIKMESSMEAGEAVKEALDVLADHAASTFVTVTHSTLDILQRARISTALASAIRSGFPKV